VTVNPTIATVATAQVISPAWGTDVADTLNAAPRRIATGIITTGATSLAVPVPVNTYERLRLVVAARSSIATGVFLTLQNPPLVTADYRGMRIFEDGSGTRTVTSQLGSGSMDLGNIAGGFQHPLEIDIHGAKGTTIVTWASTVRRIGSAPAEHQETRTHGRYSVSIALNQINLSLGIGATFAAGCRWYLEGSQ
jgi:hypothetical protein